MRDKTPFSWIEDAEASRVVNAARFERDAGGPRARPGLAMQWARRLGAWLAEASRPLWPASQVQPALVRARVCRPHDLPAGQRREAPYRCEW